MIPIKVTMKGWMRYRDETVADFSEGNLIAICGANGAGKSSIFDAMTFALYGQHRLGKQKVEELISEGMDYCSVDFEFEVDGQRYIAHRGRGTKSGDGRQSLHVWADGDWRAVAGTEKEAGLNEAVLKVTRLTYPAFTSSFMLQQGGATEFIDSDPKDRFDILSSLIGLDAYRDLERRAREAAAAERTKLTLIEQQLAEMGDVDEKMIVALKRAAEAANKRLADTHARARQANDVLAGAEQYAALTSNIALIEVKIAADAEIIAQREQIQRDADLFETISSAMGKVTQVGNALADASRAEAVADDARAQAAAIDMTALRDKAECAAADLKAAAAALKKAERADEAAGKAEREASDFAQLAAQVLQIQTNIVSFDERVAQIDAELKSATAMGKKLETATADARGSLQRAEAALTAAHEASARAAARHAELQRQLAERKEAAKEATCSRCGQKIDKTAAKREVQELTASLQVAQAEVTSTAAAERAASKERATAGANVEAAVKSATAHERKAAGLSGQRDEVVKGRAQAAVALAEHTAKLNGRMKDIAAAAAALAAAQTALKAARAALNAARLAHDAAVSAEARARDDVQKAAARLAELNGIAQGQADVATVHRASAEGAAGGLGELGAQALADPGVVMQALKKSEQDLAGAPSRKAALVEAQERQIALSAQREMVLAQMEAIPAAHRIDAAAARENASAAAHELEEAQAERDEAVRSLAGAEERLAMAAAQREERDRSKLRHKLLTRLRKLLGKEGLQGALVADALEQVSSHSNAFLKRLTGGTLQLVVEREEKSDRLEVRAIDATCMREAHPVKALSGSQKFRCAVAIASGIGQYAGAGGMRSIVIDEGFASLDQESQKTMVQELKELATYMDKVIVVSHLEAFAEPADFPHRINVETRGDTSVIEMTAAGF